MRLVHFFMLLALLATITACGGSQGMLSETQSYAVQPELGQLKLGNQTANIRVRDHNGQPVVAEKVVVLPLMESMGMTSPESTAKPMESGRYQAENVYFSMTGEWEIDVRVSVEGRDETARFLVTVDE